MNDYKFHTITFQPDVVINLPHDRDKMVMNRQSHTHTGVSITLFAHVGKLIHSWAIPHPPQVSFIPHSH